MDKTTYAVVDLETTGHSSVKGDRIIQIAIVLVAEGRIQKTYMRFVNPGHAIPPFISQLTNISNEDVQDAMDFKKIAKEVAELLKGTVFIAHNIDFDLGFLQHEFARCGLPDWTGQKIDTVELTKILFPSLPSYRLQDIAEELNIPLSAAHRADDDAQATALLFLKCLEKMQSLPAQTLNLLHRRSFMLKSDVAGLFYESLKRARAAGKPIELPVFRGIPYRRNPVHTKEYKDLSAYPQSVQEKTALFEAKFPRFEKRDSQFHFMDAVHNALVNNEEIAAEVPTGIGKTVAYLLPAAMHAKRTGKSVVISTYTNHLADKIVQEEVQKVRNLLGIDIAASVLKGREQYISLGKFEQLLRISDESYDETFTSMQILVWLTETVSGDLEELNVSGGGQLFVNRIRKREGKLMPDEYEADYHIHQMKSCMQADLIITNHMMLLSDLQREQTIFKSLGGLIIDEAHQFVHAAERIDETVFSYTNWKYTMGQISSEAQGQLLQVIEKMALRFQVHEPARKMQLDQAQLAFATAFDEAVQSITMLENKGQGDPHWKGKRVSIPLTDRLEDGTLFRETAIKLTQYVEAAKRFIEPLQHTSGQMTPSDQAIVEDWLYWINELSIKAGEWVEIFIDPPNNEYAVWLEKDKRSIPGSLRVVKTPIRSAELIRETIDRLQKDPLGIIWTSGTLVVAGDNRFVMNQLGLKESVPLKQFFAPLHFYEGAEIFIVEDMPDIQQVAQSDYIEAVANAVIQTVIVTGGRLFVLFTSQDMLRKTYELIVESEQLDEYALIAQGVSSGSRMKLLKSFRQFNKSVLFGTNSFWEGVDVPGEALTAVIVVRLPFSSPDDPVFQSKAAWLQEQGIHPFMGYSLPQAVMRLRQGFGRLIRSSSDKGFFIILDRRIQTKSYGKRFIASLPDVPIRKVTLENMVNELENCYND